MTIVFTFIKKYWKVLFTLFALPLLYLLYRIFFLKSDKNTSEYRRFLDDYQVQIEQHGRVTSMDAGLVWERSKKIAEAFGTHKDSERNTEEEELAVSTLLSLSPLNDDFFFIEGTYKAYMTNNRNLISDCIDYLSNSQYDEVVHLFAGGSWAQQPNTVMSAVSNS